MSFKMVFEIEGHRFEKYEKSATVNTYIEGRENAVTCFTDYTIGTDIEKFKKSCTEWHEEILKEYY